ncbi:MAG: hypothetical protein JNM91_01900, partial [Flavobacteriales bacterium]|nr:hypothetical protein [Flavobacteriales bacterium]
MKRTTTTLLICGLLYGQVEAQQNYTRLQTRMLEEAKALYDGAQWSDA